MASHVTAKGAEQLDSMTSPSSAWLRAGTVSVAAHALVILGLGFGTWLGRGRAVRPPSPADLTLAPLPLIDLSVADDALPPAPAPEPELPEPPAANDAPPSTSTALAVPSPGPEQHRPPAPDSGNGAGRAPGEIAWRRDRSTLRDRLTNDADRYQPAHSRVARTAASPQADRREPAIGLGDAPRAARAAGAPPATSLGMADDDAPLRGGDLATPGAVEAAAPLATAETAGAPAQALDRAGPLDTARGARAFDVQRRAPAADDRSIREASAELHPSVTDLSAPSAPGPSNDGHGPAARPGPAAPAARPASAPSLPGHLGPASGTGAGSARERAHAHYEAEIRARVNRALVFPRSLAVRLLLGETMLSFSVAADGHLEGAVAVTKSAGYEEFDRAAMEAVRRAAPFPPLPAEIAREPRQARSFALRVTFSNPVIR